MSGLRCIAMHDRNLRAVSHCRSGFLLKNINCIWCYPSKTHGLGEAEVVRDDRSLEAGRAGSALARSSPALVFPCQEMGSGLSGAGQGHSRALPGFVPRLDV